MPIGPFKYHLASKTPLHRRASTHHSPVPTSYSALAPMRTASALPWASAELQSLNESRQPQHQPWRFHRAWSSLKLLPMRFFLLLFKYYSILEPAESPGPAVTLLSCCQGKLGRYSARAGGSKNPTLVIPDSEPLSDLLKPSPALPFVMGGLSDLETEWSLFDGYCVLRISCQTVRSRGLVLTWEPVTLPNHFDRPLLLHRSRPGPISPSWLEGSRCLLASLSPAKPEV